MAFLRCHFEKVILGLGLVVLLVSCYYLLHTLQVASKEVERVQKQADQAVEGGKTVERFKEQDFDGPKVLTDPRIDISIRGSLPDGAGGLVEPPVFVRCKNMKCFYLLPFETDICPYCKQEQPEVRQVDPDAPKATDREEDFDGDGIPNRIEAMFDFLNPNDPTDAGLDYDGDGFTNLEEYLYFPDNPEYMADPTKYPPLAMNLRYLNIFQQPLPIRFEQIMRNQSDDKQKWDIVCLVSSRGRVGKRLVRIGQEIVGFKVLDVVYQLREDRKLRRVVDLSELTLAGPDGQKYILLVQQPAFYTELNVRFLFLSNRYDPRRCHQFVHKEGDEFMLQHSRTRERQRYKLVSLRETQAIVVRLGVEEDTTQYRIRRFNLQRDIIQPRRRPQMPAGMHEMHDMPEL